MLRGEIYYADLSPVKGSEQGGLRPVLIIQNDVGNKHSPTTIVACLTTKCAVKHKLPTHIMLDKSSGLPKESMALLEQLRTIDKQRLKDKVCHLDTEIMKQVNNSLLVSLELDKDEL
jgi:mRNA interferase MazF